MKPGCLLITRLKASTRWFSSRSWSPGFTEKLEITVTNWFLAIVVIPKSSSILAGNLPTTKD